MLKNFTGKLSMGNSMNTRYHEMIMWSLMYGLFALLTIGMYCRLNKRKKLSVYYGFKKIIYLSDVAALMILIGITAIRCNCGSDYYNYYIMYNCSVNWYHSLSEVVLSRFQNGYMVLSYLVKSVIGGEFAIFWVVACIVYIPIVFIIRKRLSHQTKAFALWIFLGFFSLTLNIIKQSIAMVCIVLAYDCMQRKKRPGYCVFSMLACFFHISSIYVVVIIAVAQLKWNIKRLHRLLLTLGMIAALFIPALLSGIKNILPLQYQHYVDYYLGEEISKDYKLQLGALVVAVTFLILLGKSVNRISEIEVKNRYCVNMVKVMVFTEPFLILGIRFFLLNRVAYEAFQFLPFVLSECIHGDKKRKNAMFWLSMFVFCMVTSILCGENNYYNYSTIFNDIPCSVMQFVNR